MGGSSRLYLLGLVWHGAHERRVTAGLSMLCHANLSRSVLTNLHNQTKSVEHVTSNTHSPLLSVARAQKEIIGQWMRATTFHHWVKHGQVVNKNNDCLARKRQTQLNGLSKDGLEAQTQKAPPSGVLERFKKQE